MITRRNVLSGGAAVAASAAPGRPAKAQPRNLGPNRLVLLGTRGGPSIRTGFTPSPPANLIVWNNVPYVIDTGYGPVMSAGDVKVTALRNLHPPIVESFALKFELPRKTVVFSGDTAYVTEQTWADAVRPTYQGDLVVAHDLMEILL